MSNKLVKEFPRIQNPNEHEVMSLKYMNTGNVVIHAPNMHPAIVTKILINSAIDILFAAFQPAEQSNVIKPPPGTTV